MRSACALNSRRRAGAGNSRCRSLRSLLLQTISTIARNKVNAPIVKSFAQAFSKACGFQRQRRSACALNSRCRSLRSLVLQTISTFARNKVNAPIVKSFAQAFSKACGFQRQSLWQVFKGGALNNQSPRSYCKPKLHSRGRRLCAGALNSRFQNKISYAKCYLT